MSFLFIDLILVAAAFASVFRGFWALRRRAIPPRTRRLATSPEPGCRPGLRLVASSEGLGRRAVTIACVGTTEELECLLRTMERRATLQLVHENETQLDETEQPGD